MPFAPPPRLIAITDLGVLARVPLVARLSRLAERAVCGSVALLLRDHSTSGRERLALGQELRDVARSSGQKLWVADRLDLALLLEADAVHLGEHSVGVASARQLLGAERGVSRAWHGLSLLGADDDELLGVDALVVSPVLAPRKGRAALGLGVLRELGEQLRARDPACQLYALGGVSTANAAACLVAGATGVAAIGAALDGDIESLLEALAIRR